MRTVERRLQCSCCGMRFRELSLRRMKHPLFVALLIVNLLTCPLRCLAFETRATSSAVSTCANFDCCQQCEKVPNTDDPAPSPQDKECGCNSCICDGAVVESQAELPDPGPALMWMLPLDLESPLQFAVRQTACSAKARHVVPFYSGRGARVAYQSWQI